MATRSVFKQLLCFLTRLCFIYWPLFIQFGWLCNGLVRVGEMVATNPHLQVDYQEVLSDVAIRATEVYIFQWIALFLSAFFIRSYDAAVL
jgi:hypothetical protein